MKTSYLGSFICSIITVLFFAICSFGCDSVNENTNKNDRVSFDYPQNNNVIGDTVLIKLSFQNVNAVEKVDYFVNDSLIGSKSRSSAGFDYRWLPISPTLGKEYKLKVHSTDKEGKIVSSSVSNVAYKWLRLSTDENDLYEPNIANVFVRSSSSRLEFRIETNGKWFYAYSVQDGISAGIFIDSDANANTGLTPTQLTFPYSVNDIGADYLITAGFEGKGLYRWDSATNSWKFKTSLTSLNLSDISDFVELGINRQDIDGKIDLRIVSLLITTAPGVDAKWDWSPNTGNSKYIVDGSYKGANVVTNKLSEVKQIFNPRYILR